MMRVEGMPWSLANVVLQSVQLATFAVAESLYVVLLPGETITPIVPVVCAPLTPAQIPVCA